MSRPKGSKNKPKKGSEIPSNGNAIESTATSNSEDHDFAGADRESIYDQQAENNPPESYLSDDEITSHDEINSGIEVTDGNDPLGDFTGTDTETSDTDASSEKEDTDTVTDETTETKEFEVFDEEKLKEDFEKNERQVSIGALHEEREKRKERDSQIEQLIDDNKKLKEKLESGDNEYGFETDNQLTQALNKIAQLEERLEQKDKADDELRLKEDRVQLDNQVKSLANQLDSEGFYGFADIGETVVSKKLNELAAKYGYDNAMKMDNPEGWAKIWRSEQPKFKTIFMKEHKNGLFNEKVANKKKANLATNAGRNPVKKQKQESVDGLLKDYASQKAKYQLT